MQAVCQCVDCLEEEIFFISESFLALYFQSVFDNILKGIQLYFYILSNLDDESQLGILFVRVAHLAS